MAEGLATPQVSVVMAVYNGADYLRPAIDSVLAQSLKDFEFIIIDDGSTDDTAKIIRSYKDQRIRLVSQANQGLAAALNKAIGLAKGTWIARQDADDVSSPDRLARQLAILRADGSLVMIGGSIKVIDEANRVKHEHRVLLNDPELKQELLVRSPFAHGSVVFSKQAFDECGGYRQTEWPAEDYGLWLRLAAQGHFANLDEPLYGYREHGEATSTRNLEKQNEHRDAIRAEAWRRRGELLDGRINTDAYAELEMGQRRLERIASNLLFSLRKALVRLELGTAVRTAGLLLADRRLRRKCARLIAVKLRFKHG